MSSTTHALARPIRRLLAAVAAICLLPAAGFGVQSPQLPGFPKTVAGAGIAAFSKVLVVDLDNNRSSKEIVVGTNTGRLVILNADGSVRANVQLPNATTPTNTIISSAAAGELKTLSRTPEPPAPNGSAGQPGSAAPVVPLTA